jgi:hypothetical protein
MAPEADQPLRPEAVAEQPPADAAGDQAQEHVDQADHAGQHHAADPALLGDAAQQKGVQQRLDHQHADQDGGEQPGALAVGGGPVQVMAAAEVVEVPLGLQLLLAQLHQFALAIVQDAGDAGVHLDSGGVGVDPLRRLPARAGHRRADLVARCWFSPQMPAKTRCRIWVCGSLSWTSFSTGWFTRPSPRARSSTCSSRLVRS